YRMHFRGTRPWRMATIAGGNAVSLTSTFRERRKTSDKSFTQFLHSCGKRFTPFAPFYPSKSSVFNGPAIGGKPALLYRRRSGAAIRAVGRELRPEVLHSALLHF